MNGVTKGAVTGASGEFRLPDVGEGLVEAELVSWQVAVGDTVQINDIVCEIETAKSVVELPSPFAGIVEALLVDVGTTVEVGTPIIRIGSGAPAGGAGGAEFVPPIAGEETDAPVAGVRRPRGPAAARRPPRAPCWPSPRSGWPRARPASTCARSLRRVRTAT